MLEFSQSSAAAHAVATGCVVAGVFEDAPLPAADALNNVSGGALARLRDAGDFAGRQGATLVLHGLHGVAARRVLLVGLGRRDALDALAYARACGEAGNALKTMPVVDAAVFLPEVDVPGHDADWRARTCALAIDHACFRYTATLKPAHADAPRLQKLALAAGTHVTQGLAQARAIARGVSFARELGCLPPNLCTPTHIAAQAKTIADEHADTVTLEVLEREDMQKLGMGALLAVASGSATPPKLIVLQYKGAGDARPQALVGKGVTFDTGGLNIKPSGSMEEMKYDMCGAAGVLGAFLAAVELRLPINLVCVVPSVENAVGGAGYRPSDVLTTHAGITVEVLNTDAEGRLILCDALAYTCQRFRPAALVDAATLTGACVVALGAHASGLFSADDALADALLAAGDRTLDRAWRLPLWNDYRGQLESAFADIANIGGKSAGAITAALFLSNFTAGTRWAHLDVAGTAWVPGRKGYATGRPVPLLAQWLIDRSA